MGEKHTTVVREEAINEMMKEQPSFPLVAPDYTIRAWFIDPYWYVITTDGTHRAISDPSVTTDEDLIWCVGEQVRVLRLPMYKKPQDGNTE